MALAIIAGTGPGMGTAIARRFAREGFDIALIARNPDALAAQVQGLAGFGVRAEGFAADLCDITATKAAFAAIDRQFGAADVLVYNGARWHEIAAMEIDPETFHADLALGVTGGLVCAQAVYPAMKAAGKGTMLFTGGGLALFPQYGKGVSSLTAGKSALRGLVHAMAGELAPEGIHVATVTIAGQVAPGGAFDPDRIAEHYLRLHREPAGSWSVEHVFDGN